MKVLEKFEDSVRVCESAAFLLALLSFEERVVAEMSSPELFHGLAMIMRHKSSDALNYASRVLTNLSYQGEFKKKPLFCLIDEEYSLQWCGIDGLCASPTYH